MEEISKIVHKVICNALKNYDKGDRNTKELYKALELVYQEWEYIQHGL